MDHLLEGALGEVGGDQIWEADQEGGGGAAPAGLIGESRERGQGGEDRRGDGEAVEALDDADAQAPVEGDDDGMRAERVALVQQLRADAVGEAVGCQQVLRHVGVEAGAEDAEVAFDREGQGGREQRTGRHREPGSQRLSPALDPAPQVGRRDDRQHRDRARRR